jgi:hypothetical protein
VRACDGGSGVGARAERGRVCVKEAETSVNGLREVGDGVTQT